MKTFTSSLILFVFLFLGIYVKAQSPTFSWAKQFGGYSTAFSVPRNILVDASGNVYTSGYFNDTVDFDPGSGVFNLVSAGDIDAFISKVDASGNFVWAKRFGSTSDDGSLGMALDASGNIYTSGAFSGTVDFDPNSGTLNLTATGRLDIFISKLDPSGNFIWAKQIGGNSDEIAFAITTDASGSVYATGYFEDLTDFDPGTGSFALTAGGFEDIFVVKLNSTGEFMWAKQFEGGNANTGIGNSIAVDAQKNVYTTGNFSDQVDFNPGSGTSIFTTGGDLDIFVSKLDSSGNYAWAKQIGGTKDDDAISLALDQAGNVHTTGYFIGKVDFNPGSGVANLTSVSSSDIFISKLDKSGNYVWAKNIGGNAYQISNSIALDASGNVYFSGSFVDSLDLNPGSAVNKIYAVGNLDAFIAKLTSSGNYAWAIQFGSNGAYADCSDITIDSKGKIYTTGVFDGKVDFDPGSNTTTLKSVGGDFFVVKLDQCNSTASQINPSVCDKYVLNGQTYTSAGVYSQTLKNSTGCDSILTINLTIKSSSANSITTSACRSYRLNGKLYTASGAYNQTLINKTGCDSILTINLTIINVDKSVTQTGATLTANKGGATYQWLDCNKAKSPISGKTSQSFTATINGSYAVVVTENTCKDTSVCYLVTGLGIANSSISKGIFVYPNPTNAKVQIFISQPLQNGVSKVLNATGQAVFIKDNLYGNTFEIDLSNQANGIYFLEIEHNGGILRTKVVKN